MFTKNIDLYWRIVWLAASVIGLEADDDKPIDNTLDLAALKEQKKAFLKGTADHQGIIHNICRVYCHDPTARKDLYQEILCQLWNAYPSFNGKSRFSTWMHKIAERTATQRFRQKTVEFVSVDVEQLPAESPPEADEDLFENFRGLNQTDRTVLMHMVNDDKKSAEIARELGVGESAIRARMTRIRNKVEKD